jgi:succinoglycan biosynthesis transport protein ExoP
MIERRASSQLNQSQFSSDSADNDIAIIVNILMERKAIIIGFCLAAMVLSFLYVSRIKPQFVSSTEILVNSAPRSNSASIIQSFLETGALDIVELRSHVEMLKSPGMVRQLIVQKTMYTDNEIAGSQTYDSFDSAPLAIQQRMVRNVIKRLAVKPVIGTAIIEVSYRSANPIKAAQIANDLIEVYSNAEIDEKRNKIQQAIAFLETRLDELRAEVIETESRLDDARSESTIDNENARDMRLTQIELLSKQLAGTQGDYIELQAAMAKLNRADNAGLSYGNIIDGMDNRVIVAHKTKLASLEQGRANLGQRYGLNHPSMKANAREIKSVKGDIRAEIVAMTDAVRTELQIARKNVNALSKEIESYRQSYQGDSQNRRAIRDLETELEGVRNSYNSFLTSYRDAVHSLNIPNSNIQVVSAAVPPIAPAYPKVKLIVLLCAITGLFMGVFFALVLEKLQNVFQSVGQIEKITGIPVYGVLPKAKKFKNNNPAEFIAAHTASGLAELVRSLYTALKLRDPKKKSGGRVVTVTSTLPDEGKTTISVWLATVAARHGDKVVIVDADMRRPSLHQKYDIGNARGLPDYLSDRLPLEDVIYDKHVSGVHLMTSKAIPTHALTLISGERMESLIRRLRDMYDLVIIDAPTSLIFSDARMMATLSDKTFYIVEWKKTRRDVLMSSVKQFTDMGYSDMAFIMNKANMSEYAPGYATDMAYLYQTNGKK